MLGKVWALLKFVISLPIRLVLRIVDDLFGTPEAKETTHLIGLVGLVIAAVVVFWQQWPWWNAFSLTGYLVLGYWAFFTTLELFWKAIQFVRDLPAKLAARRLSSSSRRFKGNADELSISRLIAEAYEEADFVGIAETDSLNANKS